MRWPRALKKMPEGASTGSSRRTAKVAVSTTVTRLLSRAESHTSSPRGVNSMCSTALPGLKVCTTRLSTVSITCTHSLSGKAKLTHT